MDVYKRIQDHLSKFSLAFWNIGMLKDSSPKYCLLTASSIEDFFLCIPFFYNIPFTTIDDKAFIVASVFEVSHTNSPHILCGVFPIKKYIIYRSIYRHVDVSSLFFVHLEFCSCEK